MACGRTDAHPAVARAAQATILHRRDASPRRRAPYSLRGVFLPGSRRHNVASECQERRCRHGQAAGRAAGLRLGLQLDCRGGGTCARCRPGACALPASGIGAATLFAAAILTGHNLRVPRGEYLHVMVAGFFNVAAFQILSGFAQLSGATSRAIIITYSMPIWATRAQLARARRAAEQHPHRSPSRCAWPA